MKTTFFSLILIMIGTSIFGQNDCYFNIEPIVIEDMMGVHSFAYGRDGNDILIIGGRIEGLHRRSPWNGFNPEDRNQEISVLNLETLETWNSSYDDWPSDIKAQLVSTNMQFIQEENHLYITGGYGFSEDIDDHTTYGRLIAVDVSETINAIKNGEEFIDFFRYEDNAEFAITGGALRKIGDEFHLAVGQNFEGRYNPQDMPTFVQEYSDEIRRFTLDDDGENLNIIFLEPYMDAENLHRRDLNVLPQIYDTDQESYVIFSGVFQPDLDIPYLHAVEVNETGFEVIPDFNQYFNHYHCATLGIYCEEINEMNNLFFGGMSQFQQVDDVMIEDINVPFVKTIANVKRQSDGTYAEYRLNLEMPELIGASAELILMDEIPHYSNGVVKYDELESDSIMLGYIVGGINSSQPNIFWINDGTQSYAETTLYRVSLLKNNPNSTEELNPQSTSLLKVQSYFDYDLNSLNIKVNLGYPSELAVNVYDLQGRLLFDYYDVNAGMKTTTIEIPKSKLQTDFVIVNVATNRESASQKIVVAFD